MFEGKIPKLEELLQQSVRRRDEHRVLVIGISGIGKSTLIPWLEAINVGYKVVDLDWLGAHTKTGWKVNIRALFDVFTKSPRLICLGMAKNIADVKIALPWDAVLYLDIREDVLQTRIRNRVYERKNRYGTYLEEIVSALAGAAAVRAWAALEGADVLDTTGQSPEETATYISDYVHNGVLPEGL